MRGLNYASIILANPARVTGASASFDKGFKLGIFCELYWTARCTWPTR
jgi:hypothetical protein